VTIISFPACLITPPSSSPLRFFCTAFWSSSVDLCIFILWFFFFGILVFYSFAVLLWGELCDANPQATTPSLPFTAHRLLTFMITYTYIILSTCLSFHPLLIRTHILVVLTVVMYNIIWSTIPFSSCRSTALKESYIVFLDFCFDQWKFRGPFSARSRWAGACVQRTPDIGRGGRIQIEIILSGFAPP